MVGSVGTVPIHLYHGPSGCQEIKARRGARSEKSPPGATVGGLPHYRYGKTFISSSAIGSGEGITTVGLACRHFVGFSGVMAMR